MLNKILLIMNLIVRRNSNRHARLPGLETYYKCKAELQKNQQSSLAVWLYNEGLSAPFCLGDWARVHSHQLLWYNALSSQISAVMMCQDLVYGTVHFFIFEKGTLLKCHKYN